jgi:hypothetical protein
MSIKMLETFPQNAAKEQAIRLAKMMTTSAGITQIGFAKICRAILRDRRSEDFVEIYGEPPVLGKSRRQLLGVRY